MSFLEFLNHRRKSGGFTLIEILIVVVLIGIIAAIAVPQLIKKKQRRADWQQQLNPKVTSEQGIEIDTDGKFWKQLNLVSNKQYRIILRKINDDTYTFIIKETTD